MPSRQLPLEGLREGSSCDRYISSTHALTHTDSRSVTDSCLSVSHLPVHLVPPTLACLPVPPVPTNLGQDAQGEAPATENESLKRYAYKHEFVLMYR